MCAAVVARGGGAESGPEFAGKAHRSPSHAPTYTSVTVNQIQGRETASDEQGADVTGEQGRRGNIPLPRSRNKTDPWM